MPNAELCRIDSGVSFEALILLVGRDLVIVFIRHSSLTP